MAMYTYQCSKEVGDAGQATREAGMGLGGCGVLGSRPGKQAGRLAGSECWMCSHKLYRPVKVEVPETSAFFSQGVTALEASVNKNAIIVFAF